jgi:hypothetical protein
VVEEFEYDPDEDAIEGGEGINFLNLSTQIMDKTEE